MARSLVGGRRRRLLLAALGLMGLAALTPVSIAQLPLTTEEVSVDTATSSTTAISEPVVEESISETVVEDTPLALPNLDTNSSEIPETSSEVILTAESVVAPTVESLDSVEATAGAIVSAETASSDLLGTTSVLAEATVQTTLQSTDGEILTVLAPITTSGVVTVDFPSDYPLDSVAIEFSSPTPTTTLVARELDAIPSGLPAAPDYVSLAGVVELELLAPDGSHVAFREATLFFTIPSGWRADSCAPLECRIAVLHYAPHGWEVLPVELGPSDADGWQYSAITQSFSPFAIVGVPEADPFGSASSSGAQSSAPASGGSEEPSGMEPVFSEADGANGRQAPFPAAARSVGDGPDASASSGSAWAGLAAIIVLGACLAGMGVLGVWVHRFRSRVK